MPNRANNLAVEERARKLFSDHLYVIQTRTDRLFALLMLVQWIGGIIIALNVSPRTWAGATSHIHIHVWLAFLLGGLLSAGPMYFVWRRPGAPITRHVIACAQMLWSALLIHLTGGRIETHFHVFGSLAFLAFYRDWRVFISATIVVGTDHVLRGIFWPQSVYGVLTATPWRSLEHVVWVLFEDIFLIWSCRQGIAEMWDISRHRASLEKTNEFVTVASETIKQSEERIRLVIDAAPSAMLMVNHEGNIVLVNSQTEKYFGYKRDELLGESVEMLVPNRFRERHLQHRAEFFVAPQTRAMGTGRDLFGLRKDGSEFPIEIGLNPIQTAEGTMVLSAIVDITERKRAEERIRLVVEAAPSAMLMVNQTGHIVLVNSLTEKYFGYSRDELLGKPVEMLVPPRIRAENSEYDAGFIAALTTRSVGDWRNLFGLRKDGSEFPIEIGLNPIQTAEGTMVLSAIVDITERKRTDERLRDSAAALAYVNDSLKSANEVLRRQNVELDEFTFIASHDLQEPLRKIIAFGDLLPKDLGEGMPETAQKDLGFITDAAARMRVLIQDLLALSRAGRAALKRERVSLNECAENAILALSDRIEKNSATITRDELPEVLGDVTQLTQLYQNLIANALKFSEPGQRPEIRLTCEQLDGERVLGVRDNGIGIKPEYKEQIFAPFKRLHGRDKFEGTGIGLSICRKAVERHGGKIWVESQPGQGAHFRFTLNSVSENTAWLREPESRPLSSSRRMTPAIKS